VVVVLVLAQTLRPGSFELGQAIRAAIFLPSLIGLTRSMVEIFRGAPRLQSLARILDRRHLTGGERKGRPPPNLPCEIRFEAVSVAYGAAPVLVDVTFAWTPNSILGIRGPNGSGKSTLLKLVLGLLQPDEGRIMVGEMDLRDIDLRAWRRKVAYLPQRPYLPDKISVLQAMQFTTPSLTPTEARAALAEMDIVGGTNIDLDAPFAFLSIGMRQRVLLARVFAQRAGIALLDEPDENLDNGMRQKLSAIITQRANLHMVCIATHDPALLADAGLVIDLKPR
jgi:ABC-type bacteriocin/lantibiotic exporter with double-glycine peptidase domain